MVRLVTEFLVISSYVLIRIRYGHLDKAQRGDYRELSLFQSCRRGLEGNNLTGQNSGAFLLLAYILFLPSFKYTNGRPTKNLDL